MKVRFIIIFFCLKFINCDVNQIKNIREIEGMWVIKSVSSNGEVFHPKGGSVLVDYYVFNSDSTGIKKKLKPNFNETFTSSLDNVNFEIKKTNGLIFLNYISNTNSWKERINKLTKNELILSNDKFEYHYERFEKN